jgi:serine protease Do
VKLKITQFGLTILIAGILLSACGTMPNISALVSRIKLPAVVAPQAQATQQPAQPQAEPAQPKIVASSGSTPLTAYQSALENIYAQVNPAVVSIRVVENQVNPNSNSGNNQFPSIPGLPFFNNPGQGNNNQPSAPAAQALGSGFVWNADGYIVTNNHVVANSSTIEVKFADGTTLSAKLVGADPDSDLAVIKVDNPGFTLTPITITDSRNVKVGQVAVAIGNPFGLENTMTVGIVSALGRTLPAGEGNALNNGGATFTIPDIIQTDASINPGNSGGPLVNDQGALIGVNSAITSSSDSNSGIGFAIPSNIVNAVAPELIKNGKYEHPYLGISGASLTPDLAKAMKLNATQRGALVEEVVSGGPADKAGVHASNNQTTIDGQNVNVGGDVITAVDGNAVKTMDDVIAYLSDHTKVGQTVRLTVLRDGKEQSVDVTLGSRPPANTQASQVPSQPNTNPNTPQQGQGQAWLGIAGQPLTADINKEMNLPDNQQGVLVEQVQAGSPADKAGLQGSFKPVLINNQRVLVGGDVITAMNSAAINNFNDLQTFMQNAQPGQQVQMTILRNGKEQTINITPEVHP